MAKIKIELFDLENGNLGVDITPKIKDFAYDSALRRANPTPPSQAEAAAIAVAYFLHKRSKLTEKNTLKDFGIWTPGQA